MSTDQLHRSEEAPIEIEIDTAALDRYLDSALQPIAAMFAPATARLGRSRNEALGENSGSQRPIRTAR